MGDVVPLHSQWAHGEAFCTSCDHRWVAVGRTGTKWLECPACHRNTGLFLHHFAPSAGTQVRECECGNQLYYLTREGHMCVSCGLYVRY